MSRIKENGEAFAYTLQEQHAILNVLANDYMHICLIDTKTQETILIKSFNGVIEEKKQKKHFLYDQMCEDAIQKYAPKEKREFLIEAVRLEKVIEELKSKSEYSLVYEVSMQGVEHDCQMRYIKLDDDGNVFMGFRIVDSILALEKEQKNRLVKEVADAKQKTREDKATLKERADELRKERMFLDVLCKDYTSVYYFDLNKDTLEILKLDSSANVAKMVENEFRQKFKYSENMKEYCNQYVLDVNKVEFLEVMSKKNIKEKLSKSERFVYQYQSNPNNVGHSYFEVQVVRIDKDQFDNTAILAFRHIDDIITAEQKHQQELENALQKEKLSNEILQAISKIYYAIFRIDLENDIYEEISSDKTIHHLTGKRGCASSEMIELCKSVVVSEYEDRIMKFFDVTTLAQRLEHEETIAEEYLAKDGNWHTARFIVNRRNEIGEVTQVLYVTRLISDAKRKEQNWIAIAQEANKANEAKTDFLRHMSHDIRTPINGILGMIEMAERHKDDKKKLYECRNKVLGAMDYLLSIVNNVLDIGKLESSEIVLESVPFDLIPLLMKQLPIVEVQAKENGIKYRGGKEMSVIKHRYLIGSPVYLNRILMNIANNAIKYNRKGGMVAIYCKEISSDENVAVYEFICSDTGIGMSEEFQKQAFEPFTQEGKEALSTYTGSGLGLSIVKKIVERMNGSIKLESKEGVGTIFTITIPFEIDHNAQSRQSKIDIPIDIDVTGKKALLVEDNKLNREIAQMVLEDEGLVLTMAKNGKEAVEKFKESTEHYYDFIFMDIMMPVMNGLEATRKIRALDRADAKTVPILAMTANAFQDDIKQSMDAGMNAHLMKPLNIDKIKEAIRSVSQ